MANHHAISAIGQAVVGLLSAARPSSEFPSATFKLLRGSELQKGLDEGVSLYLYRVTLSTAKRNIAPRTAPSGRLYRRPLPLDLYYLLTPWGRTAEMQHVLLGWAMRVIEDTPVLGAGVLNAVSPGAFHDDETVELLHDAPSVQDLVNIWEPGKPNTQLSVGYVARVVPIESQLETADAGPVQTRVFELGRAT